MSKSPQENAVTAEFEPPPRIIIETKPNSLFFPFALLVDANKWPDLASLGGRKEQFSLF